MDDNVLKKFLSTCMKRASTNIGYNESLFTGLLELHLHFIPFIQELELAVKESIAKELLNDIKECLKNLYYLSNKSTKKLRSLKKLINVLDGLVDLTDNCVEDNSVAPITAYGIRLIGHLVKALERAINKFAIYLTDLENIGRKEKKQK